MSEETPIAADRPNALVVPRSAGALDEAMQALARSVGVAVPSARPVGGRPPFLMFHVTPLQPCPYLPGRMERKLWTDLAALPQAMAQQTLSQLSVRGFRRSHRIAYRPACPGCSACVPIRVAVDRFEISRGQNRVRRRNAALAVVERPARVTADQFCLFRRYLRARHGDGEMAEMTFEDYRHMVEDSPRDTRVLEFHGPDGRLRAACIVDRLEDGLSAVYSWFDPDRARDSLGSLVIMALIARARQLRLPHVYLGYWVGGSAKMDYKARFRPTEGFVAGRWQPIESATARS